MSACDSQSAHREHSNSSHACSRSPCLFLPLPCCSPPRTTNHSPTTPPQTASQPFTWIRAAGLNSIAAALSVGLENGQALTAVLEATYSQGEGRGGGGGAVVNLKVQVRVLCVTRRLTTAEDCHYNSTALCPCAMTLPSTHPWPVAVLAAVLRIHICVCSPRSDTQCAGQRLDTHQPSSSRASSRMPAQQHPQQPQQQQQRWRWCRGRWWEQERWWW